MPKLRIRRKPDRRSLHIKTMFYTTKGLILRETQYKDNDKLLDVLTGDMGRITVKARGVRRKNSRLRSGCQLLCYSELTLFEKNGFYTVNEAEPLEMFMGLRTDIELLSLGSYFAQLLSCISDQDQASPELLSLGLNSLYALDKLKKPQPLVKAAFELRLMAHFSGDAAMLEAFRTGQDVHARTASEIFDVPLSEVTPQLRSRAKAVNFGLIYGISGFGLARNTGVSPREAQEFIRRYFEKYPGVKRFMEEAAEEGKTRGYAETLMGRRRYLPELQSTKQVVREFGKRAAMNTPVQGTAADIIKLAMVRVDESLRREKLRSRLILQVHDELLLECPPDEVERASVLLRDAMEHVIALAVPLEADVHEGANWADAK